MKKLILIMVILTTVSSYRLHAQQSKGLDNELVHAIVGTWKVIKYESKNGTYSKPDTLVFKSDGTFLSDSIYFATKTGFFRTDENRGVLILENGTQTTEWTTTVKKGVLRMRTAPNSKQPKIYITSVRVTEG